MLWYGKNDILAEVLSEDTNKSKLLQKILKYKLLSN